MGRPREDVVDRFWRYVQKLPGKDACWEWTGKIHKRSGYGIFQIAGEVWDARLSRYRQENVPPHRFSFELHCGPLGELCALHRCDNRKCVRPGHLFKGTKPENQEDMRIKGRAARGERTAAAKLTEGQVKAMRQEYAIGSVSQYRLAKDYGISQAQVSLIIRRKNWSHVA